MLSQDGDQREFACGAFANAFLDDSNLSLLKTGVAERLVRLLLDPEVRVRAEAAGALRYPRERCWLLTQLI